jgi:hypothetical protein
VLTVSKVESAQSLSVEVAGPDPANRLWVLTGIAEIGWQAPDDDQLRTDTAEVDLAEWHRDVLFNPDPKVTQTASIAWPASMHATDDANQVTWAVDKVNAFISAAGRPMLDLNVALQGSKGALMRVAYQVFLRTTSPKLLSVAVEPNVVTLPFVVKFRVTVLLAQNAIGGSGEPVALSSSHAGVSLPRSVRVPMGTDRASVEGSLDPAQFPFGASTLTISGDTGISQASATLTVTK